MLLNSDNAGQVGDENSAHYPPLKLAWSGVVLLFFFYVLSLLDRNLVALLSGPIKSDLRLSDVQLGLLLGPAFAISFAISGFPFGWALDKFSRRTVVCIGVGMWSVATAFCGLARSFPTLLSARVGLGVGEASIGPAAQSIIADSFPPKRLGLPISVYSLGGRVGQGMSLIVAGILMSIIPPGGIYDAGAFGLFKGWHVIFLVVGLPGVVLGLAVYLIPEPPRRIDGRNAKSMTSYADYFAYVKANLRFFVCHHLAFCILTISTAALSAWAPAFFSRVHDWSPSQVGYRLGAAILIGTIIGMPTHGAIADWWYGKGRRDAHLQHLMITIALATPIAICAFLVSNPWLTLVLISAFLAVMGGYLGLPMTMLQIAIDGRLRGKAAAVLHLFTGVLAVGGGPTVVAFITDHIYGNPNQVGYALATCFAIVLPIGLVLFYMSGASYRHMVRADAR